MSTIDFMTNRVQPARERFVGSLSGDLDFESSDVEDDSDGWTSEATMQRLSHDEQGAPPAESSTTIPVETRV